MPDTKGSNKINIRDNAIKPLTMTKVNPQKPPPPPPNQQPKTNQK